MDVEKTALMARVREIIEYWQIDKGYTTIKVIEKTKKGMPVLILEISVVAEIAHVNEVAIEDFNKQIRSEYVK